MPSADLPSFSAAGLVAPHPLAAAAGRDVLIEGGTVVEAALAAAMMAVVVVPQRTGLGGDALWLVREAGARGRVRVLDARGLTGRRARPERLHGLGHDAVPRHGPEAMLSVPGTVAGWAEARALAAALGGRLPLARLLAPAIAVARDGFDPLPREAAALAAATASDLAALPGFADAFLVDDRPPAAGTRWRFPTLAATLDYLGRAGLGDLYRGDVARELAADLQALGCPLERDDLRGGEARWRAAATLDLGRETVDVAPHAPAVSAAVALGLFAGLGRLHPEGFDAWHGLIESLNLAPAALAEAAAQGGSGALLDREVLKRAAERIDRSRAAGHESPPLPFPEDGIFIGAVDRDGAAAALVQTLGGAWGSGIVSRRTGILLGNRCAALALDPERGPRLAPGRRAPLFSTPMLLANRDGRVACLGATGAQGASLTVEVAARLLAGVPAEAAVAAPRVLFGHTPDGDPAILVEEDREPEPERQLRAAGHPILPGPAAAHRTLGLVTRLPSGRIEGVSDDGEAVVAGL